MSIATDAFFTGTLFQGGQEISLEGISDLKEPIKNALSSVIPNVYPRFAIADRSFEFAKNLKALLSPTTSELHKVAPDLQLFDTQGSLQRESALVAQVLEVLTDLRDEDADAEGARIAGNPQWLASALQKIERAARGELNLYAERNPATAHMFIINPLSGMGVDSLFSTHPATEERIRRLRQLSPVAATR